MIKCHVMCQYHSIFGSWNYLVLVISGVIAICSTRLAHKVIYCAWNTLQSYLRHLCLSRECTSYSIKQYEGISYWRSNYRNTRFDRCHSTMPKHIKGNIVFQSSWSTRDIARRWVSLSYKAPIKLINIDI